MSNTKIIQVEYSFGFLKRYVAF